MLKHYLVPLIEQLNHSITWVRFWLTVLKFGLAQRRSLLSKNNKNDAKSNRHWGGQRLSWGSDLRDWHRGFVLQQMALCGFNFAVYTATYQIRWNLANMLIYSKGLQGTKKYVNALYVCTWSALAASIWLKKWRSTFHIICKRNQIHKMILLLGNYVYYFSVLVD